MSLESQTSSNVVLQGLLSEVRGPSNSKFNLKPQKPVVDSPGRKAETDGQTISWVFDTSRLYDPDSGNFDISEFS